MTLDDLHATTQQLLGQFQQRDARVTDLTTEVAALQGEQQLLGHVTAAFDTLIEVVSKESMGAVEQLVTYGLRTVFQDAALSFRLVLDTKRGVQWAEPVLTQDGVEAPILDAFGGGPAAVAALLLRILVCRRTKLAPVILLDESLAFVSSEYRPRLGALLRELADAGELTILMVTHDPIYIDTATRAYAIVPSPNGSTFKAL